MEATADPSGLLTVCPIDLVELNKPWFAAGDCLPSPKLELTAVATSPGRRPGQRPAPKRRSAPA